MEENSVQDTEVTNIATEGVEEAVVDTTEGIDTDGVDTEQEACLEDTEPVSVEEDIVYPNVAAAKAIELLSDDKKLVSLCHNQVLQDNDEYKEINLLLNDNDALGYKLHKLYPDFNQLSAEDKVSCVNNIRNELNKRRLDILSDYTDKCKRELVDYYKHTIDSSKLKNAISRDKDLNSVLNSMSTNLINVICDKNKLSKDSIKDDNKISDYVLSKLDSIAKDLRIDTIDFLRVLSGTHRGSVDGIINNIDANNRVKHVIGRSGSYKNEGKEISPFDFSL